MRPRYVKGMEKRIRRIRRERNFRVLFCFVVLGLFGTWVVLNVILVFKVFLFT